MIAPPPQIRAYSPSEVEDWLRCPVYWWLKRQGWQPRVEPEWTPNRLVGTAIQAGLAHLYRDFPYSEALEIAHAKVDSEYVEQDTWTVLTLRGLVARGIDLAAKGPQRQGMVATVLAEQDVYGRRPDAVFRDAEGRLVIDDNKVALSLDARWEAGRLAEYEHSWQLRDYAWHVRDYFAEEAVPVTRVQLIVLGPRKHVVLHPVPMTVETLSQWHRSAREVWATMGAMEAGQPPWQNLQACTNRGLHFGGRCPMYEFCHVYHGDPGLAHALYKRGEG